MMTQAAAHALPAAETWTFTWKGQSLQMKDLFYLGMYAALKSDVITGDKTFPSCEALLALLSANTDKFVIPSIIAAVLYALERMKNHMGFFGTTQVFTNYATEIEKILTISCKTAVMDEGRVEFKKAYEFHMHKASEMKEAFGLILDYNIKHLWCAPSIKGFLEKLFD